MRNERVVFGRRRVNRVVKRSNTDSSAGNIWIRAKANEAMVRPFAAISVVMRIPPFLSASTENSIKISAGFTGTEPAAEKAPIGPIPMPPPEVVIGTDVPAPGGFGSLLLLPEGDAGMFGSSMLSLLELSIVIGRDEMGRDEKSKDL